MELYDRDKVSVVIGGKKIDSFSIESELIFFSKANSVEAEEIDGFYHHSIFDYKTNRTIEFRASKNYSSVIKDYENEIKMNGINVFDDTKTLSDIIEQLEKTI